MNGLTKTNTITELLKYKRSPFLYCIARLVLELDWIYERFSDIFSSDWQRFGG